jgi:predicted amidohydrolase YtcJ
MMGTVDMPVPDAPRATLGPVKVLLDDTRLPEPAHLASLVATAHHAGRPIAVHCVTRVQAAVALAALEDAGSAPGDRMEHGAVLGADQLLQIRRLGLTVVTQPAFVSARGDEDLREVDAVDLDDLWRLGSLLAAGLQVAIGTDSPYGPSDPWEAVKAAATRRAAGGRVLGAGERVLPMTALQLLFGRADDPARPRTVSPGQPADLCLLDAPLQEVLAQLIDGDLPSVRATLVAGEPVYHAHG